MTNPSFSEADRPGFSTVPVCPHCDQKLNIIYTKTPEVQTDYYGFDETSGMFTWNQDSSDIDDDDHGSIYCGYCHLEIKAPEDLVQQLWKSLSNE